MLCGCPSPPTGWIGLFGGPEDDEAYALYQAADGGFIVAGMTQSYGGGGSDMYLLKLDRDGNLDWSTTFGGADEDTARAVVQTRDRGYVMAGRTESFGAGGGDGCLVKVDQDGVLLWNRTYGTGNSERFWGLAKTSDNGFIMVGTQVLAQKGSDIFLVKARADGTEEWNQVLDYGANDEAFSVIQTTDGGYAFAGVTLNLLDGWSQMLLVKTDENGNEQWSQQYGDVSAGLDICQTGDGGFALAGLANMWSADPWEEQDGFLVKTDEDGVEQWSRVFDSPGKSYRLTSVQQTGDDGFILGGDLIGDTALLLKTAPNGTEQWMRMYGSSDTSISVAMAVIEVPYYGGFCFAGSQYHYSTGDWSAYVVRTDELGAVSEPLPIP
jgi:hypothetical protein